MAVLKEIGHGACGSVWASDDVSNAGANSAYKRGDGGRRASLPNDFAMHALTIRSFERWKTLKAQQALSSTDICVPRCHRFVKADDDDWWSKNFGLFPAAFHESCEVLESERVHPVSLSVRSALTEKYCPDNLKQRMLLDAPSEACLIRLYLGRQRFVKTDHDPEASRPHVRKFFSLRNFPLHIDQAPDLGLSDEVLARHAETMAEAIAVMHWIAGIDAGDVEFVLGAPRSDATAHTVEDTSPLPDHTLWMLDFDLCKRLELTESGMQEAARAFLRNDPYCPRPRQLLWTRFRQAYLAASRTIMAQAADQENALLPLKFIESVEAIT